MSTLRTVLLGTLVILALGAVTAVQAAVTYDAVLEWTGPYFRAINAPGLDQMVDKPVKDTPFVTPFGLAASEHAVGARDVVYVLDAGHSRVQAFEANALYVNDNTFTYQVGGVAAADDYDTDQIYVHQWAAAATHWILPHSEIVTIDGIRWTWVASLAGFAAADHVYTIDYSDATNAPEIKFPATSLTTGTSISLYYAITDNQGGVTSAFGIGDVDYGTSNGAAPVLTKIDPSVAGGPSSWQLVHAIALSPNMATATSDDIFLLDPADNSTNQNEKLFYYTVPLAGTVSFQEAYDDVLTNPYGVAVAPGGTAVAGTATLSADGTFTIAGTSVYDRSQLTGHVYTILTAAGATTITDATTGRILISAVPFANLAGTFLGIPGVSLTKAGALVNSTITLTTVKRVTSRYLFVADTGADRIKMISCEGATLTATDDWLPGDAHTGEAQPAAAGLVGASADRDYRYTLPTPMVQDLAVYTNSFPIKEGTLSTVTLDPAGTPVTWNRINDLATAGPTDRVFQIDWTTGKITFGDGVHGAMPAAGAVMQLGAYSTTPDVIRYGSSGSGPGRFSHPRGIAARWNPLHGYFDVYVADTGNNRIQKFAFHLGDSGINMPAYAEYICEWSTVNANPDYLNSPVSIAVMLDNQLAGTGQTCYLAVADQGNRRIAIYKDNGAMTADAMAVPVYDNSFGVQGNALGQYMQIEGLCFLQSGNDLDLYTVDAMRGTVTKYTKAPTPLITLAYSGVSLLPQCFSPASSYTFSFSTTNPPTGGTIDFYYDTVSYFSPLSAKPCITEGSISAASSVAVWTFADTPGGVPPNGIAYYLFARMKNSAGTTVAYDQTDASHLFCMDSSLLPSLRGADRIDGDYTLYLQNGLERSVNLQIQYPDSCILVGFGGTFDPTLVQITGIAQGTGWDPTGYTNVIFNPAYSNTAGNYLVNSSITGSRIGLVSNGPHNMAILTLRATDNAIDLTNRFKNSTLTILQANSGMKNIHGLSPSTWRTQNIRLRFGYLGDIATTGGSADSVLPHLVPKPDGKINFEDQMAFTLGWNGKNNVQDPIADIGPTQGTVPDLQPIPDGKWDVEDILSFTTMYSWAAGQGFYRAIPGSTNLALNRVAEPRPLPMGEIVQGAAEATTLSHLTKPKSGELMTVDLGVNHVRDLSGALFNVGFDPAQLELVTVEKGGFLDGGSGSLFFHRTGDGWVEVATSRLDQRNPSVDGSGVVASLTFRILDPAAGDLNLRYDLRSSSNTVLARGSRQVGPYEGTASSLSLYSANPNPVQDRTNIVFSLPSATSISLNVFDVTGRMVRTLASGQQEPGYHVVSFDGRNSDGAPLPAGVYFYRLQAAGKNSVRKLIITR